MKQVRQAFHTIKLRKLQNIESNLHVSVHSFTMQVTVAKRRYIKAWICQRAKSMTSLVLRRTNRWRHQRVQRWRHTGSTTTTTTLIGRQWSCVVSAAMIDVHRSVPVVHVTAWPTAQVTSSRSEPEVTLRSRLGTTDHFRSVRRRLWSSRRASAPRRRRRFIVDGCSKFCRQLRVRRRRRRRRRRCTAASVHRRRRRRRRRRRCSALSWRFTPGSGRRSTLAAPARTCRVSAAAAAWRATWHTMAVTTGLSSDHARRQSRWRRGTLTTTHHRLLSTSTTARRVDQRASWVTWTTVDFLLVFYSDVLAS